jgi:hypothetical protein
MFTEALAQRFAHAVAAGARNSWDVPSEHEAIMKGSGSAAEALLAADTDEESTAAEIKKLEDLIQGLRARA